MGGLFLATMALAILLVGGVAQALMHGGREADSCEGWGF
jgi:cbb3-type cytochrome oxidase subunit 3